MLRTPPDPLYTFRKDMAQINCIVLYSDSNNELLYVCTVHGFVHIWDLKTKREVNKLKVCDKECLAIARYQDKFILQERGEFLKFWKEENFHWYLMHVVKMDYYGFCKVVVENNDIYCPSDNGVISAFLGDLEKPIICDPTKNGKVNKSGEVMCIKLLQQQHELLAAYESGDLSLWVFKDSGPKITNERKFKDTPMCIDFCELSGEGILGTSGDSLTKFSVQNNVINEICSTTLTNPGVSCVTISEDGRLAVAGCWDGRIRYFSMKQLSLLAVLNHHSGAIQYVMFLEETISSCCDGTLFAAGSDGRISLWDLYTKRRRKENANNFSS